MEQFKDSSDAMLFTTPVTLVGGVSVQKFHTASRDQEYLLSVSERRFQINQSIAELVELIDGQRSLDEISKEFSIVRNKSYKVNDIVNIINHFFVQNGLVVCDKDQPREQTERTYLRFRFPFLSKRMIHPITGVLQVFFHPFMLFPMILATVIFHIYYFSTFSLENFQALFNSPVYFFFATVLSFFSIILHEFGHASACRYYGAEHGYIGAGVYLYFPVFFTDVTDVWRLPRFKRTIVDFGGLYFQFIFNLFLFGLYLNTNNKLFLYPILFIGIQTISTLNPFFRFDGYWIASDLIGIPNLRKRSKETLIYLIRKVRGRKLVQKPFLTTLKLHSKIALIVYAGLSNLFFIFILFSIGRFLPGLIMEYPSFLQVSIESIKADFVQANWKQTGVTLYQIIFRTILVGFICVFIFNALKRFSKMFVSLWRNHMTKKIPV